jgi:predicted nucleotidyltransferase
MIAMNDIEEYGRRIGEEFRPERVLLFGSYANGEPTPDSDVDLMVVMPHKTKGYRVATEIRGRIHPPFPLDLIVRTPEQIRERLTLGDCFIRDITRHGKVLYEASDQ